GASQEQEFEQIATPRQRMFSVRARFVKHAQRAALVALAAAAAMLHAANVEAGSGKPTRPNLLLIVGDNWSFPHASVYGTRVVKTPTFDALARRGALFTHAFAPFPSCSPSRAAL